MRIYIPSPEVNANPDVPMIRVSTADNVCATDAYTINVPSKDNRYVNALTWTLTDDECDLLLEELAAARGKRLIAQEKAYETLREKFAGPWDNGTEPTCDICGKRQIDTEDLEWNGETGNHVDCEVSE